MSSKAPKGISKWESRFRAEGFTVKSVKAKGFPTQHPKSTTSTVPCCPPMKPQLFVVVEGVMALPQDTRAGH